jgi:hypothetical protein
MTRYVFFLKSTVLQEITVPTYTRRDGTVVPSHRKMVHVNAGRSVAEIVSGRGSSSQREAYRQLSRNPNWGEISRADKHALILAHATEIQRRASNSAALTGWARAARSGRNPTAAQWLAFSRLPEARRQREKQAVENQHGSTSHLRPPAINQPSAPQPSPQPRMVVRVAELSHREAMSAVPVPDLSGLSNSETNQNTRRRMGQLARFAAAGDYDAVVNFSVSRTRRNYALVADYRDALMNAVTSRQAVSAAMPVAPVIGGANPNNSALIAAQRRVRALEGAAQSENPVAAILAIHTTRHNYMRAVDDYRTALLAHFGHAAGGEAVVQAALAREKEQVPPATAQIPPSQNPLIAANPLGLSEEELGFVPRPNVPLSQSTLGFGVDFPWPHREMAELNRRYLQQPAGLQRRARKYQRTQRRPERPAPIVESSRGARPNIYGNEERRAAEMQRRIVENGLLAEAEQRAAVNINAFKPVNRSCHNVNLPHPATQSSPGVEAAALVLGVPRKKVFEYLGVMVADYGGGERFNLSIDSYDASEFLVKFTGSKGTIIKRRFVRYSENNLSVFHAYFKAGASGNRSGTSVLRNSMWLYKKLNVKQIKVYANIDVGGYAWARFGFKPSNWRGIASSLKSKVANTNLPVEIKEAVNYIIDNGSEDTLWKIADMQYNGRKIGKELLMGTCWNGNLSLDNEQSMRRFAAYVTR